MMKMRTTSTRAGAAAVLALAVGSLSACGTTMRDLPIPGTGVSGDTIEVKAQFDEALNLAVGAPVKVNGVDMGKVKEVTVDDFVAEATLTLKTDAELRDGAQARLRYTTPLGELFVDVTNPATGAELGENATLELKDTQTAPTVEDALAQASLLINGGGLEQLQTVTEELNTALSGNEGDYRTLLDRASVFLTQANATTQSIDQVLNSLNGLSTTLVSRQDTINKAVKEIQPAAKVLREKTPDFTRLLAEIEKFSAAANSTVNATRSQLLTMLTEVEPVLAEFAKNNGVFDQSLQALIKGAAAVNEIAPSDYLNIALELHVDGLSAAGLVEGTLASLLNLLGVDLSGLGLDLGLLGLGKAPAPTKSGATTGGGGTTGSGSTSDPLGLNGLLHGLLGGGSR
ncbi:MULTISPECIES: MCE family protein [unclassified Nocardioides]|uniref:MCE family protein n=1 Tax=unclassified Nocardioides TaxID=2615069 RepID=UPI000A4A7F82|nr:MULTISPECIES: MCE family protein [unclassified Nocardioides]